MIHKRKKNLPVDVFVGADPSIRLYWAKKRGLIPDTAIPKMGCHQDPGASSKKSGVSHQKSETQATLEYEACLTAVRALSYGHRPAVVYSWIEMMRILRNRIRFLEDTTQLEKEALAEKEKADLRERLMELEERIKILQEPKPATDDSFWRHEAKGAGKAINRLKGQIERYKTALEKLMEDKDCKMTQTYRKKYRVAIMELRRMGTFFKHRNEEITVEGCSGIGELIDRIVRTLEYWDGNSALD